MGIFSSLFGKPPKPSRSELDLLVKYAFLLEGIGMDAIFEGVEEALLPAGKHQLRDIIAKVSLHKEAGIALYSNDLPRAYGLLAFFFSQKDLDLVRAAQRVGKLIELGETTSQEDRDLSVEGMRILVEAHNLALVGGEELARHAASLT